MLLGLSPANLHFLALVRLSKQEMILQSEEVYIKVSFQETSKIFSGLIFLSLASLVWYNILT